MIKDISTYLAFGSLAHGYFYRKNQFQYEIFNFQLAKCAKYQKTIGF